MVYESDFYTTRRPYSSRPSYSTYTVSKREIPWEKVPFVPRPSLVPDPVTAFGKRKPAKVVVEKVSVISPLEKARIRPKPLLSELKPYVSARDQTREKVMSMMRKEGRAPQELPSSDGMDVVLPRLHKLAAVPTLPYKRQLYESSFY